MQKTAKTPEFKADNLRKLIGDQPKPVQALFARVINIYAGFNISELSEKELQARVRREIEESAK
jgi:hypothetical protein